MKEAIRDQKRCISEHNVNIVNMINYVVYIYYIFFYVWVMIRYCELPLLSMGVYLVAQKQYIIKKLIMFSLLETLSFKKLSFSIDFY